ncbi:MAG: recombinase family protein [Oceanihabitans sp.]
MIKYIAYYRVSSKHQGLSGLGLEAQKSTVRRFLSANDKLLTEYEEIETGKSNTREQLNLAIAHCQKSDSILIIAKLDRLSRNVVFISKLMETNIEFVACDMPHATKFTLHIFAALAEQEAKYISDRTIAALKELKRKGVKLGNPQNLTDEARRKGTQKLVKNAVKNPRNKMATLAIIGMRENEKLSYRAIAMQLNKNDYRTSRGKEFSASQVLILYDRHLVSKVNSK